MKWWVIATRQGLWLEQATLEPLTAVAGPYETHQDALDKLRRLEEIDTRNGRALGWIGLVWLVLMAEMLVASGFWVIGEVV